MSKHTPGHWVVGGKYSANGVFTVDGELIANTHSSQRNFARDEQIAEQDANARLIAAAPDLLRALKACCRELYYCNEQLAHEGWKKSQLVANVLDDSRNAIAKAEGL